MTVSMRQEEPNCRWCRHSIKIKWSMNDYKTIQKKSKSIAESNEMIKFRWINLMKLLRSPCQIKWITTEERKPNKIIFLDFIGHVFNFTADGTIHKCRPIRSGRNEKLVEFNVERSNKLRKLYTVKACNGVNAYGYFNALHLWAKPKSWT